MDSVGWLLAIDSSTEQAGVALFDGHSVAELSWIAGRTQTTSLLNQIDHLLRLQAVTLDNIAAIAVAIGPGAFSGLRVGIGIAKGLCFARDLPLVGVPTLDAAALPFARARQTTIAVVQAGRGRLVWAVYSGGDADWRQTVSPVNGTPAELIDVCQAHGGAQTVTGELSEALANDLAAISRVVIPPPALRSRRPGAVADLAWTRFRRGETDDPASLAPLYLHGR